MGVGPHDASASAQSCSNCHSVDPDSRACGGRPANRRDDRTGGKKERGMTSQPLTLESIVIDDEFASLMPRLTDEERTQLHVNMLRAAKTGDRVPDLAVWKGKNILLDGHNRLEIAK